VDPRTILKNSGAAFLAFLLLFLSTGIHDLASHTPAARTVLVAPAISFAAGDAGVPSRDHCGACLCTQLLNHCLFPVLEIPYLTESPSRPGSAAAPAAAK